METFVILETTSSSRRLQVIIDKPGYNPGVYFRSKDVSVDDFGYYAASSNQSAYSYIPKAHCCHKSRVIEQMKENNKRNKW